MNIVPTEFTSCSTRCVADLYLPEVSQEPVPVIVMAHGFAGERSSRLPAFAERFCEAGFAVFLFDYRTFGDSDGVPRQWVSPKRQLQDWRAAIAHVREQSLVDTGRLILWGTSFSGGHVVKLASEDRKIAGIIAQVPFVTGLDMVRHLPLAVSAKMTISGLIDVGKRLLGAKPNFYPVVGHPGEPAVMNTPESYDGYMQLIDPDGKWVNQVPASILLEIPLYHPIKSAHKVKCPALIIAGRKDSLIPIGAIKKMADLMPRREFVELDSNHFEPYVEPLFEQNIQLQISFLKKYFLH